jgi:hypothetical protein
MTSYLALAGLLLSIIVGAVAYTRGEAAAELSCQQVRDKVAAQVAADGLDLIHDQQRAAEPPRVIYVETIKALPGPAVVLDRLGGVCLSTAEIAGTDPAVPGDRDDVHAAGGRDAPDRRAELARDVRACALNKAKLVGLQQDLCAKSSPEDRANYPVCRP